MDLRRVKKGTREMTANELAFHSLIVRLNGAGYYEAATILRQQQAEIEAGIELVKKFQEERDELKRECDRLYRIIELNGTLK
jgi:hypothetical protein